jgi:hypothetical protein
MKTNHNSQSQQLIIKINHQSQLSEQNDQSQSQQLIIKANHENQLHKPIAKQ